MVIVRTTVLKIKEETMEAHILDISTQVREVSSTKRYWFIRTYGGEAYHHYMKDGFVGLGLNKIPYNYITEATGIESDQFGRLQTALEGYYGYKKGQATQWAKQLVAFEHDVQVGDYVLIPSTSSEQIAIGKVTTKVRLVEEPGFIKYRDKNEPLPNKIRRIEWIKVFDRDDFQGDLKNMFFSRKAITSADAYYEAIEGILSSLFIRDNQIHLVVQIKRDTDINAFDLSRFLNGVTYFYKEFCDELGEPIDEDLSIKIKVQSKGKTLLKAAGVSAVLGIAGIIALSNNPELKVELTVGGSTVKVEGKGGGGLGSLSDFLDRNQKRKMEYELFQDSIRRLDASRNDSILDNKGTNYVEKHRKQKNRQH